MGWAFVLLVWGVIGATFAAIGAVGFRYAAVFLTRGAGAERQRAIFAVTLFPFACLGWAAIVVIFQAVVNAGVLHRDVGFGDTATCPLPNGYSLLMIDVPDRGIVFNPKTEPASGILTAQADAVDGVRFLQVSGRYILGASDSQAYSHPETPGDRVDSYFLLDARVGSQTKFATLDALRDSAEKLGIQLKLEPINSVYVRYRYTWFDLLAAILLVLPPVLAAFLLLRWIFHLRRSRVSVPETA
jgi:hypothetical protein